MRKVFLENVPRRKGKSNQIDWIACARLHSKIKFIYDDIEGEVEIIDFNSKTHKLTIQYLDENIFIINYTSFSKCRLGEIFGKATSNFKINIGTHLMDCNRNITIINRKHELDINRRNENRKFYKYKCNKCGFDCGEHYKNGEHKEDFWIEESNLLAGKGCSCCINRVVVQGINDIPTTAPWMIPYFQGGYDEAKKYTKSGATYLNFKCPDCGKVKPRKMTINSFYGIHNIGCICGDGIKYPEKLMYGILEQLGIQFIYQLTKKYFDWCNKYMYDYYIPSINTIIEMDGGFHKHDNKMSGQTKEESKETDDFKDKLAEKHGIKVIRIDCEFSDLEFIKNNIFNSELNNIFDLSKIDWSKCDEFALSNLVKKACEIKRDNPDMTTTEIGAIVHLHQSTICRYLKKGTEIWDWCNYDTKEETRKSGVKSGNSIGKPIEIFKDGISLGIFSSGTELERQSKELFGIKLLKSCISSVCIGKFKQYKGFTFNFK